LESKKIGLCENYESPQQNLEEKMINTKANRIGILKMLSDSGAIGGSGPLSILLVISFGVILLSGASGITEFANYNESSIIPFSGNSDPRIFQLAQRACTLSPEALTTERVVLEAERAALEALGYSPSGELRLKKSFRNNNRIRMNNG
jgi:hypothetical protein